MSVYSELGVKRVINAAFALTRLGGSTVPREVQEAMNEANKSYCNMWDLFQKGGKIIADITGAEAAWITSGGFAALVLGAAACIAGKDPEKMRRIPDTSGMKNEFIIQRNNRLYVYDRAMEVAGGKFVFVGDENWGCGVDEFEAAITDKTAGIHYAYPTAPKRGVPLLKDLIKMAHNHGVPVIVDAAGMTYPVSNFKMFADMKADIVAFGGKYVLGPNSTGFAIGRRDLIEAMALHSFIGVESGPDEMPGKWRSIGRGYKLDRQEIVGLIVAFKRWMALDHEAERIAPAWERARYIEKRIKKLPGLSEARIRYIPQSGKGIGYNTLGLNVHFLDKGIDEVTTIVKKLKEGDPEIWVRFWGDSNNFIINTLMLLPGQEKELVKRFEEAFA
jgi:D-glucosaminate-6-phosphate ammonia-lyase